MAQLTDNDALLIYRVGPVLCCAPTRPVETLIQPPSLTHPPGSSDSHPGIFRHDGKLVSLIDVRQLFGIEEQDRTHPGRIIICHLGNQHTGFLVDEVIDVIDTPASGWGQLSPSLSGGVFNRSLLLKDKIHLYTEFEKLQKVRNHGFLKPWIEQLQEKVTPHKAATTSAAVVDRVSVPAKEPTTASPPLSSAPSQADLQPDNRQLKEKTDTTSASSSTGSTSPEHSHLPHFQPNCAQQDRPQLDLSQLDRSKPDHHQPGAHEQPPVRKDSSAKTKLHDQNSIENKTAQTASQPAAPLSTPRPSSLTPTKPAPSPLPRVPDSAANTSSAASIHASKNKQEAGAGLFSVAVLLISAGLIATLVYLWPDHNANPTRTHATRIPAITPHPEDPAANKFYVPNQSTPAPILDEIPNEKLDEIPDGIGIPVSHDTQNNENRYHAAIEQQTKEHGANEITIIITAPTSDEVIRTDANSHRTHEQSTETSSRPATPGFPADKREARQQKPVPTQRIDQVVHIVVKGDTLWHIARRYIHNPFRYPELARLNKIHNPNLIYPGDRVRIIRIYRQPAPVSAD